VCVSEAWPFTRSRQADLRRRDDDLTFAPPLFHDPREEPQPELVLECRDRVAAKPRTYKAVQMARQRAEHVARHAGDARHLREIQLRVVGRIHVDAELREQNRAADPVPVVPAPEVLLLPTIRFNDMMNY